MIYVKFPVKLDRKIVPSTDKLPKITPHTNKYASNYYLCIWYSKSTLKLNIQANYYSKLYFQGWLILTWKLDCVCECYAYCPKYCVTFMVSNLKSCVSQWKVRVVILWEIFIFANATMLHSFKKTEMVYISKIIGGVLILSKIIITIWDVKQTHEQQSHPRRWVVIREEKVCSSKFIS